MYTSFIEQPFESIFPRALSVQAVGPESVNVAAGRPQSINASCWLSGPVMAR